MSDALSNLTNFVFNGQSPPQISTYSSTTQGIPDWLAQAEINLLNTSAGTAQGLSQSGYPLAGLPQIGAFNPNYGAANSIVSSAGGASYPYVNSASQTDQSVQNGSKASLGLVSPYATAAAGMSGLQQASPYLNQGAGYASNAAGQNYLPLAQSYINQGVASSPLTAAAPLVGQATAPLSDTINSLMQGSYIPQASDALAAQSARNLEKYLLPASDSQFISNGQAGSSRNQDYDALTTAYANQDLLAQQSQMLQQGYQSATQAALGQQGTLASLAGTVGGLGAAQQSALMNAGTSLANVGYQGAQTQLGAANQLGALGQTFGNLTAAQQQALLNSGALLGSTNTADVGQQLQAASQQAGIGQQVFNNTMSTAQGLDALGQENQNYNTQAVQANNQNILNTANWTPDQLSWLSNILHGLPAAGSTVSTTNQGPSSVYSPSPAAQIGGLATLAKYT